METGECPAVGNGGGIGLIRDLTRISNHYSLQTCQ
jgi:hypothetical protein